MSHLNAASINYGRNQLTLKKSEELIAVKPSETMSSDMVRAMVPELDAAATSAATLGGFQLVNTRSMTIPMEATLDTIRENPAINAGSHVYYTSDDKVPFVPTGQLLIEFKENVGPEEIHQLLEKYYLNIVNRYGEYGLIVQVSPDSPNPIKITVALQKEQLVALAEPELATLGRLQAFVMPGDGRISYQWHLRNTGNHRGSTLGFARGADARVLDAWQASETLGSPNVIVAVIDDGFDLRHPDLSGNGKVISPWDFSTNSPDPAPKRFHPDSRRADWHGTACAGVAVGAANGTGIVGAAPNARLMPVRWGPDLSDSQIEKWFGYVQRNGAWVVSCSWGAAAENYPLSTRQFRAIERCAKEGRNGRGTIICFAAGNENRDINDPANESVNGFAIHPNVIAVAASNSLDKRSSYSNFGREISVCAPSSGRGGWGITTSDVIGQFKFNNRVFEAGYSPGDYTDDFGGTSSATPLVAGICALLFSIRPDLTADQVKDVIEKTSRRIGNPGSYINGHSREFGHGCINALAAVRELIVQDRAMPAWGAKGHRTINTIAVDALPARELKDFFTANVDYLDQHAMDADNAKKTDPQEGPRHFIDIDMYGEYPFKELPEDYEKALEKFGLETVNKRGILPWQIERTYNDLVQALKDNDGDLILRHAAWLGHYVADAHVPLHTTENHDGKLTGQGGLHSYFETRLLQQYVSPDEIEPENGIETKEPIYRLAFKWVRDSYTYVAALLEADAANGGRTGNRNLKGFAKVAKPIAISRLTKACQNLATLWQTAYVDAGMPDPRKFKFNDAARMAAALSYQLQDSCTARTSITTRSKNSRKAE